MQMSKKAKRRHVVAKEKERKNSFMKNQARKGS